MNDFFVDTDDCEQSYEKIRDNPHPRTVAAKSFIERLWEKFSEDISLQKKKLILNDSKKQLFQVFWEMYFFCAMRERGINIQIGYPKGPDFFIQVGAKKIWFEAVAPTSGKGEDKVQSPYESSVTDLNQIALRYTNALVEKQKQYVRAHRAGIIGVDDGYILAINSRLFDFEPYYQLPIYLRSFLPIGDLRIEINKLHSKPYFERESKIRKLNDSLVRKDNFLNETYCFCSAVLHSSVTYDHDKIDNCEKLLGYDFSLLHNPLASFPLNCNELNWCTQYSVSERRDNALTVIKHQC